MKKKLIVNSLIGGILAFLFEALSIWRAKVYLTHTSSSVMQLLAISFFEGAFLFLILTWRGRLGIERTWRGCILYFASLGN